MPLLQIFYHNIYTHTTSVRTMSPCNMLVQFFSLASLCQKTQTRHFMLDFRPNYSNFHGATRLHSPPIDVCVFHFLLSHFKLHCLGHETSYGIQWVVLVYRAKVGHPGSWNVNKFICFRETHSIPSHIRKQNISSSFSCDRNWHQRYIMLLPLIYCCSWTHDGWRALTRVGTFSIRW